VNKDASKPIDYNYAIYKYALIAGILHIFISLIFFITDYKFSLWRDVPFVLLNIVIIILFIKKMSEQTDLISFGSLLKFGFTLSLFFSLIALIYIILYLTILDANYPTDSIKSVEETLIKVGMSQEKIYATMQNETIKSTTTIFITAFFTKLIFCTIVSAIGAAIFKKEK